MANILNLLLSSGRYGHNYLWKNPMTLKDYNLLTYIEKHKNIFVYIPLIRHLYINENFEGKREWLEKQCILNTIDNVDIDIKMINKLILDNFDDLISTFPFLFLKLTVENFQKAVSEYYYHPLRYELKFPDNIVRNIILNLV